MHFILSLTDKHRGKRETSRGPTTTHLNSPGAHITAQLMCDEYEYYYCISGVDALVDGSGSAASPPKSPSSGQFFGWWRPTTADDAAGSTPTRLECRGVGSGVSRSRPGSRTRGRTNLRPPPRLCIGCDRHQTQEAQYHGLLRREAGVYSAKQGARPGRQEETGVGVPGKQRILMQDKHIYMLNIHSDSTTGATQHLSDAHNIQSAIAAAGTKRWVSRLFLVYVCGV